MKKSELISYLQEIEGDFEVTTSDRKGLFCEIKSVELQKWGEGDKESASITLVLNDSYDSKKLLLAKQDSDFIDSVNENIEGESKIDKEEALEAREVFYSDLQDKCEKFFDNEYDNIVKESMTKLFDDDKPLADKTNSKLRYYVYINGWQDEFPKDLFNDRSTLITFLSGKLEKDIKERAAKEATEMLHDDNVPNVDYGNEIREVLKYAENIFDELEKKFSEIRW